MSRMFFEAKAFNSENISKWDVSKVTNMSMMFYKAAAFNQDLNNWNVSNVTNMSMMFFKAATFNQDLTQIIHSYPLNIAHKVLILRH
ncbi:hypothetical protein JBKA6_1219 [Ichthyobacterium seriolicida]|uniref:Chitinase n=2 Tax=Ichthyobacterium seriolicida TaxID=242600 RepID=A0A1J1ECJ5_9FLAO|nr:hypothetical protein JBKA6_1219 [Ichthyobacterium seriolicida]